ncbi:MAG: FkbM family methyltransferase, partial [Pseudolabrys sp.]
VRLDDLNLIPPIDYAKIDIQGAELDAIEFGEAKLGESLVVELDVSFIEQYRAQPLFFDIAKRLHDNGMMFHCYTGYGSRALRPFVPSGGLAAGGKQWVWADAVFVRHPDRWGALSDRKLRKFALILHYVYESYDFANHALVELDRRHGTTYSGEYMDFVKSKQA